MDLEKMKALMASKSADIAANRGDRQQTTKIKDAKTRIRVLPGWDAANAEVWWHDFGQHFIKGADGKVKAVVGCMDKSYGRPCATCDALAQIAATSLDDNIIKLMKDAKASARILVNATFPESKEPNKVHILEIATSVFMGIVNLMDEWGNIIDPATGRDVVVTKTGTGLNTEYSVAPAAQQTAVPKAVLEKLNNLADFVKAETTDASQKRAINSVAAIGGILPPESKVIGVAGPSSKPALSAPVTIDVDEQDAALVELEKAGTTAAAPAAEAPAAKTALADVTVSDSDLDELLGEL